MQRYIDRIGLVAAMLLGAAGCGSSSLVDSLSNQTSGTETREVRGVVPTDGTSTAKHSGGSHGCRADSVVAFDSAGNTVGTVVVEHDCRFAIVLRTSQAYTLQFQQGGTMIAVLHVQSGTAGFTTAVFLVTHGIGSINLGQITFMGQFASCEKDPSAFTDRDGDGIADQEDPDDDNDGIFDDEEGDCDLDGTSDDLTVTDNAACDAVDTVKLARVLHVSPWAGRRHVALCKRVKAWIGCRIDPQSVMPLTFRVESAAGKVVACTYVFVARARGHKVACWHREDPFAIETTYTATIDGVTCLDGRAVARRSWSWTTRPAPEADDDGVCQEDQVEESGETASDSSETSGT